ncbi:MAG: sigma-70 family RNA polymerase sigma factor [Anaerotignum sp.]|nr:sigma-70 family RNA polymerase sigma factor [Anaerotignum sp.]
MKIFESLYREYYQKVYAFLYRLSADPDLAEDLTQETFLQAYKSFHKFRGDCEVFTWLAAIGKYVYFKYLKKKKLHLDAANLELVAKSYMEGDVSPEEHIHKKDVEKAVRKVVDSIPPKYRDVVLLRIYAELPFSQIAQILKITESSAKVIYFRAKKMLMEELKNELEM